MGGERQEMEGKMQPRRWDLEEASQELGEVANGKCYKWEVGSQKGGNGNGRRAKRWKYVEGK